MNAPVERRGVGGRRPASPWLVGVLGIGLAAVGGCHRAPAETGPEGEAVDPASFCIPGALDGSPAAEPVVAAERAFCEDAAASGVKASFLRAFAPDGVVFRPLATLAIPWYEARPAGTMLLSWRPSLAGIAASGDLGFTTGPWEARERPDQAPVGTGEYFTIWSRSAEGALQVLLDHGIAHPPGEVRPPVRVLQPAGGAGEASAPDASAIEARFGADGAARGEAAWRDVVLPGAHLLREGQAPTADPTGLAIPGVPQVDGSRVSAAGDLVATWGTLQGEGGPTHVFTRVWLRRMEGGWGLAAEVITELPAS